MSRVLDRLGLSGRLRGGAAQRRCACPIHRGDGRGRTFGVNPSEGVFCCFDNRCGKQRDVIDLWAALRQLSTREATLGLVWTFHLEPAASRVREWLMAEHVRTLEVMGCRGRSRIAAGGGTLGTSTSSVAMP